MSQPQPTRPARAAASAAVPPQKTMKPIRRITPMPPGAEVLESIKALL